MGKKFEKIRSRFGFSWTEWNRPRSAQVVGLILIVAGSASGLYFQAVLFHRGITIFEQNELYGAIATAVAMLFVYIVGMSLLALID